MKRRISQIEPYEVTSPFTEVPVCVRKRFWAERYINRLDNLLQAIETNTSADDEFMTTAISNARRIVVGDINIVKQMVQHELKKAYAESEAFDG